MRRARGARDFDYGLPNAARVYRGCNFPSLLANCHDDQGIPVADAMRSQLVPWHGRKIGIVGVAGESSLDASAATLPGAGPMHDEEGIDDDDVGDGARERRPGGRRARVQLLWEAGADVVIVLASVGGARALRRARGSRSESGARTRGLRRRLRFS